MPRPPQPELRRSGKTIPFNRDEVEGELEARDRPRSRGRSGPVPAENRPGHHPEQEQDKPDRPSNEDQDA